MARASARGPPRNSDSIMPLIPQSDGSLERCAYKIRLGSDRSVLCIGSNLRMHISYLLPVMGPLDSLHRNINYYSTSSTEIPEPAHCNHLCHLIAA